MQTIKFDLDKGIERLVGALFNPIIVMKGQEGSLTQEQIDRVQLERLANVTGPQDEATDYEACMYLMSASFAEPLGSELTHVYMYAFAKVFPHNAGVIWQGEEPHLEPQEEHEYKKLKRWIYKKQVEGKKAKEKRLRAEAKTQ